ncbi:hypothetical protein M413DRAFT_270215 [Hebeloma cylindrosporum]|uniref:Uncharacterized protein n=1 Tax=Hebeloma cylindrosporum TaxID=76867 RepID=A0A0C2YBE5_HEBCY|nr:hypothetical protein M413DRAFT_270215 [Hebeloma cylindrosporum h7]
MWSPRKNDSSHVPSTESALTSSKYRHHVTVSYGARLPHDHRSTVVGRLLLDTFLVGTPYMPSGTPKKKQTQGIWWKSARDKPAGISMEPLRINVIC